MLFLLCRKYRFNKSVITRKATDLIPRQGRIKCVAEALIMFEFYILSVKYSIFYQGAFL